MKSFIRLEYRQYLASNTTSWHTCYSVVQVFANTLEIWLAGIGRWFTFTPKIIIPLFDCLHMHVTVTCKMTVTFFTGLL